MKKLLLTVSALASAAAFAAVEPDVCCLSFSTQGPDTYADGTKVYDGECYALVWYTDDAFDGVDAKGNAVNANERVVYVAACAKDGKCPEKIIQISDDLKFGGVKANSGKYAIYLLDTRKYVAGDAQSVTVGKGNPVNAAALAVAAVAGSQKLAEASTTASVGGKAGMAATAIPADIQPPKIVGFTVKDETVEVEVEGTSEFVNYTAQTGDTVAADGQTGAAQVGDSTKNIILIAPKVEGGSQFIKVIRK